MVEWFRADFWRTLLDEATAWFLDSGPTILVILVLAFFVSRSLGFAVARFKNFTRERGAQEGESPAECEKRAATLASIVHRTARALLWGVVAMIVLRELGVDVAPLIAGAGVAGLAVGFGAQNLVRDVLNGFFMIADNQIRTGDVVVINGTVGLVESLNLRRTLLRDVEGVVHIFPNGSITTLSNRTMGWSAAVFDISVAYKEDTDRVADLMQQVGDALVADPAYAGKVFAPFEILGLDAFHDNAVVVKARLKTRPGDQWEVGREYRRRLKKIFEAHQVEFPFPHRTVTWGAGPLDVRLHPS